MFRAAARAFRQKRRSPRNIFCAKTPKNWKFPPCSQTLQSNPAVKPCSQTLQSNPCSQTLRSALRSALQSNPAVSLAVSLAVSQEPEKAPLLRAEQPPGPRSKAAALFRCVAGSVRMPMSIEESSASSLARRASPFEAVSRQAALSPASSSAAEPVRGAYKACGQPPASLPLRGSLPPAAAAPPALPRRGFFSGQAGDLSVKSGF